MKWDLIHGDIYMKFDLFNRFINICHIVSANRVTRMKDSDLRELINNTLRYLERHG